MLASILLSRKNKDEQNSLVFFIWGGIIEHILVTGFHSLLKKTPNIIFVAKKVLFQNLDVCCRIPGFD